jgi:hypothetical protein
LAHPCYDLDLKKTKSAVNEALNLMTMYGNSIVGIFYILRFVRAIIGVIAGIFFSSSFNHIFISKSSDLEFALRQGIIGALLLLVFLGMRKGINVVYERKYGKRYPALVKIWAI